MTKKICWRCFWSAVIGGITVFVVLFLVAMWNAAMADHHYTAPHTWIQPKMNGSGMSCCGSGDVAEVPNWEASGIGVGGEVTAVFPDHGEQTVTVRRVYPSEDAKSYITYYGCLMKQYGI